jgi:hypothetical protein
MAAAAWTLAACAPKPVEAYPEMPTDTDDVTITCDGRAGNAELLDHTGNVYVHVGLITSKSIHGDDWRYVKFRWASLQPEALATPAGSNHWTYSIRNPRKFFGVAPDERIFRVAVLFRTGGCIGSYCKVLRTAEGKDFYIPVRDQTVPTPR